MISAVDITLQFGGRILFDAFSFRIGTHDRIGLVGSNGAGKTTLLRLLAGEQTPDRGTIARARFATIGYLPQETTPLEGRSLYTEVESVFADILGIQARLEELQRAMAHADQSTEDFQDLLEVYGELQERLEASDVFRMKASIEKVLMGLGFRTSDFDRPTAAFSGGWQMRIALAKLLLAHPSLLLLDEPTNHLDLDSLEWLEEFIAGYRGSVVIVSHDRRFLDSMTRTTFELSMGRLATYAGNYTFYLREREERRAHELAAFRNQQQQIRQTQEFIERFRYKATKARQVQSRIKQLEKLDLIQIEDEEGSIHFSFPPAPSSGRVVMELRGLRKSYGALTVFSGLDLDIDRGDRIAFVGVNGAGKSTLARIIAGTEPFDGGTRTPGHNVLITYFAQHQGEELDPALTVLDTVDAVAVGDIRKRLRNLLGCFLFSGDDVFKTVKVLSGGEKSRLALAKMLLLPSNLLVMDEPTNHLDMRSKGVLQEALKEFEGSYVIVSHDRDFLDPLVNKVVEFHDGRLRVLPGTMSDYLDRRHREQADATASAAAKASKSAQPVTDKERKRIEAEQRQRRYERTRPVQTKIATTEKTIEKLEAEKTGIEHRMADADFYRDGDRAKETAARYKEVQGLLNDAYFRWGTLTAELERLQAEESAGRA
jgi:ATP-binding cassette subfamily F protein 3